MKNFPIIFRQNFVIFRLPVGIVIADVFYRRGLVERWGRGTQKIVILTANLGASFCASGAIPLRENEADHSTQSRYEDSRSSQRGDPKISVLLKLWDRGN